MTKIQNLKNKKIGILGLGDENLALTKYLIKKGVNVVICDEKPKRELGEYFEKVKDLPVQFRLGPHYLDHLEDFKVIFRTPGLSYLHPKIQKAKEAGVEVSSQIKLFFDLCPCPIIGVTGTKGKGTTATLISEILRRKSEIRLQARNQKSETNSKFKIQNSKIYLAGNIGNPPIEFVEKLKSDDIVVLELSSFQLQDLESSPHIAVILDIKIDHLDYHQDEKEYVQAKSNIVRFQTQKDFAVINADYLTSFEFAAITPAKTYWFSRRKSVDEGAWIKNNQTILLRIDDEDIPIAKTSEAMLKGEHNLENICAATVTSYLGGAKISSIQKIVKSFKGLEHRLEHIRMFNGINFYNDSFSTTPDTTIAAIKSFRQPIILLLGGSEKKADYHELGKVISLSPVKAIISIGMTGQKIIDLVKSRRPIEMISETKTMAEAVDIALSLSKCGDIVLLSPASASFDRYKNYKERGEFFRKKVLSL